ncbi:hypothetical protein [Clostridium sp. LIBA-8841]|uniref:hypothetical protein n=1 Tax=Clostridium sp. LIBA-8841 TaxID=2987530 RepID=UPI002AC3DBD6|nr:hypothetical protein [Clostridium sp. LIBA-8841]MDZ5254891.1 hypothetical protein [Clostridium sp. LIBA-8841]
MGTMHKEIVKKRRDVAIVISIICMSLAISLSNFLGNFKFESFRAETITDPIFLVLTLVIFFREYRKCNTSYKYSIVANQLMIHKMKSNEQSTLENVKINNIVYLGKDDSKKEKEFKTSSCRKYVCSLLDLTGHYCCIYKKDDRYHKFYFKPSKELVNKLEKNIAS